MGAQFRAGFRTTQSCKRRLIAGGATLALAAVSAPAFADSQNERALEDRVEQLERELRLLRNQQRRAGASSEQDRVVRSGNDKVSVTVSGQVNRAFVAAFGTGPSKPVDTVSVDNDNSSSRLRVEGRSSISEDVGVLARIEFELQDNASDDVGTGNDGNDIDFNIRKVELRFTSRRWGALWLGQGDSASDDIAGADLSGTTVVATSDVKSTFGGIEHEDSVTGTAFAATFDGDALFNDLDGNSRQNRVRYDTPAFFGVQARFSYDEDNTPAVALFYSSEPVIASQRLKVEAAAGMTHRPTGVAATGARRAGDSNLYAGSVSVLHVPTGFSVTFAGGTQVFLGDPTINPWYIYVKTGYRQNWFDFGETRFSVDYTRSDGFVVLTAAGPRVNTGQRVGSGASRAHAIRFAVVQKIDRAGTELYFAYGYHDAYVPTMVLNPFHAVMAGARVKF